jgi:hypothetical protein
MNTQPNRMLTADRGRAFVRSVLFLWVVLLGLILLRGTVWPHRNSVFPIFADAGYSWIHGIDLYDAHAGAQGIDIYRYSPMATLVFVPFSVLPDAVGANLWRLVNFAVFFAGWFVFCRALAPGRPRLTRRSLAWMGVLLLPVSLASLNNAQANPLVIGLLLLAVVAVSQERWNLATIALTVPILFKVYPIAIAFLLLVVYPRQLGWRLTLALAVGFAVPFLCQDATYVAGQYRQWFTYLIGEERRHNKMSDCYRDLYLLIRWVGYTMPNWWYLFLQLATAAGIAGIVAWGRRRWPRPVLLVRLLDLGCLWMLLLGPATENCTFILLAPMLARVVWEAYHEPRPVWTRGWLAAIVCVFVGCAVITALPGGRDWTYPMNPLAALMLAFERLLSLVPRQSPSGAAPAVRAQAA